MDFTHEMHVDKPKILIVDDEEMNLNLLEAYLFNRGYELYMARDGEEALEKISNHLPDLILLDVRLPKIDGLEVCRQIKGNDKTRLIPVILITALDQLEDKIMGIDAGAEEYMLKPINKLELLATVIRWIKVKRSNDHLESVENVIFSIARFIEKKDFYTQGHTDRVSAYAYNLGKKIYLQQEELDIIKKGGALHDVGKIGIPDAILSKPGRLTEEEYKIIKTHPVLGYEMCLPLKKTMGQIIPIIRNHHEKLDGSGYPDGLKGDQISVYTRIMAIADVFDALTTDRPYRPSMTIERAIRIMREESERGWWDKDLLEEFIKMREEKS